MIYYSYALLNIPSTFVERLSSKLLSRLLREPFDCQTLTMIIYSLARIGIFDQPVFELVVTELRNRPLGEISEQHYCLVPYALSLVGYRDEPVLQLFAGIVSQYRSKFTPQGLSNLLLSYCRLDIRNDKFLNNVLDACSDMIVKDGLMSTLHISNCCLAAAYFSAASFSWFHNMICSIPRYSFDRNDLSRSRSGIDNGIHLTGIEVTNQLLQTLLHINLELNQSDRHPSSNVLQQCSLKFLSTCSAICHQWDSVQDSKLQSIRSPSDLQSSLFHRKVSCTLRTCLNFDVSHHIVVEEALVVPYYIDIVYSLIKKQ